MRPIVTLTSLVLMLAAVLLSGCGGTHGKIAAQLVSAAAEGDKKEVERLLNAGAAVDVHARDDWTPLTVASREGHADVVALLLRRGASVNLTEGGGHTALFWARKYGHSDVEKLLLAAKAKDE